MMKYIKKYYYNRISVYKYKNEEINLFIFPLFSYLYYKYQFF